MSVRGSAAPPNLGPLDGTYRDSASGSEIQVLAIDGHTLKVMFDLLYPYQSPMGPMANLGAATGTAKLDGNVATYSDSQFGPCTIHMTFAPRHTLTVTQDGTDFECGFGHNVTATGTYVRVSSARPSFRSRNGG